MAIAVSILLVLSLIACVSSFLLWSQLGHLKDRCVALVNENRVLAVKKAALMVLVGKDRDEYAALSEKADNLQRTLVFYQKRLSEANDRACGAEVARDGYRVSYLPMQTKIQSMANENTRLLAVLNHIRMVASPEADNGKP